MARLNSAPRRPLKFTHEGGPAVAHLKPIEQLRRSVLSCLLWEKEFYEDGLSIADRIVETALKCDQAAVANLAIEARKVFNLRHVPLLLLTILAKTDEGKLHLAFAIERTISRSDELGELLSVYWRNGRLPVPRQMRLGLARAFTKFDEYQLAKYDRDDGVKLRDVLRIVRPKPTSREQTLLWKRAKNRELVTPDTWEVALSGGADKKETFTRLINEDNLGYLALLRNLRNMVNAGVDTKLIKKAIVARKNGAQRVLPFRYTAAARVVPQLEPALDEALCEAIAEMPSLEGKTVILIDVSGSMDWKLSEKSDLKRIDAAATLGAIVMADDLQLFTFSDSIVEVPPRRGMAGVEAIIRSQPHGGTNLGLAIATLNENVKYDRLIVITDEQTSDRVVQPTGKHNYLINVASNQNGVGYGGKWVHIDGFSEAVLRYIHESERHERV
jgi:60 kDa SS-A/Ro ribonucleoprotein